MSRTVRFVIVGLAIASVACNLLKRRADADAGTDTAPDPAAAAPVDAGAPQDAAADAKAATKPAAGKPAPAASAAKGNCYCLPDEGTVEHGNNERLAPTPRPPTCGCEASGVRLCPTTIAPCTDKKGNCPGFEQTCKNRFGFKGAPGGSCSGWTAEGTQHSDGKLSCFYDNVDTYPGPRGNKCKGFLVTGKQVDGHVFCPGN